MRAGTKTAVVAGGTAGVGRATAIEFARSGYAVAVLGRNRAAGQAVVEAIEGDGGTAMFHPADISDDAQVQGAFAAIAERFGGVDAACNAAATPGDEVRLSDATAAQYDAVMGTNLRGLWLCLRAELQSMAARGGGAIVNVSSLNARRTAPGYGFYAASKAAVVSLSQTAAVEGARLGIRANAVDLGAFATDMLHGVMARSGDVQEVSEQYVSAIPLRRIGSPEEAARAIVWLCSDAASYITGAAIAVDGGMSAR